ncbi:hypothetical protein WDW37_13730 [Bdellovibrionota bacterium FG-1]
MKNCIFASLIILGSLTAFASGSTAGSVEIRAVFESPNAASIDMKANDDGTIFHVAKKPILLQGDIADASVTPSGEQSSLNITLTDVGAKKIKDFTATHVGSKMVKALPCPSEFSWN